MSLPIDLEAAWRGFVATARAAAVPVAAIEAYWRGDRDGLHIALVAIAEQPSWRHPRYTEIEIARVPAGRTHTGPEWPEATFTAELGERVGRELGVPFHFASRDRPRDEVIRWWRRGEGLRCDDCGLELDQNPAVHWFGMCYSCHIAREDRTPRLHVELLRDVGAREYDRLCRRVDAALYAARVGLFYAGSRVHDAQSMWFLASDARRAAEIAVDALRGAGLLHDLRVRAARSAMDDGEVVWPLAATTAAT